MYKNIYFFILIVLTSMNINGATIQWNLKQLYGIHQLGFVNIITDARNHFVNSPNDIIIVIIDAGTYNIGGNGSHGIDLTGGIAPGSNGRLIFQGAGINHTKLIFTDIDQDMIFGRNVYRLEFRDMHMARATYTVTQGNVVSVAPGEIVLDIHNGFPTPLELFNSSSDSGRYLRRYTNSLTDPQVIQENNKQVSWGWRNGAPKLPELVSVNQWRFFLNNTNLILSNYHVGEYVGIKSKHEGNVYWFATGSDLVFENIKWTGSSRGLVRGGFSNVKIKSCRIDREESINGQIPCLSTPSGGPQMNQLSTQGDDVSVNMVVEDFYCDSPGDDCVAFFNVNGGKVINSTLKNSFARGIMVSQEAYDICVIGTTIPNSPIVLSDEPTPITRTPVTTYDLNDAYTAGFIHDDCSESLAVNKILVPQLNYKIVNDKLILQNNSIIDKIYLYSLTGALLIEEKTNASTLAIDISSLKPSLYLLKIQTKNGFKTLKIYIR